MSPHPLFHFQSDSRNWIEQKTAVAAAMEPKMDDGEHTTVEREVADIIIYLLHQQASTSTRRRRRGRRDRRRCQRPLVCDSGFPCWSTRRKRSVPAAAPICTPHDHGGGGEFSHLSSPSTPLSSRFCKENSADSASSLKPSKIELIDREAAEFAHCRPNVMQGLLPMELWEGEAGNGQKQLLFWPLVAARPQWRSGDVGGCSRVFSVPDLNVSAEELVTTVTAAAGAEMRKQQQEFYETACRKLAAAYARRRRKELQRLKTSLAAADTPLCPRVR